MGIATIMFAALGMALPADAVAPTRESVPFSDTFPAPVLTAACGFPVTGHLEGTETVTDFVDAGGNLSHELTLFRLVASFSANGQTITGRTAQPIKTTVLPDGTFSVAFLGTDGLITLPGAGPVIGAVGRLLLVFSAEGDLVDAQVSGPVFRDPTAICAALAP